MANYDFFPDIYFSERYFLHEYFQQSDAVSVDGKDIVDLSLSVNKQSDVTLTVNRQVDITVER